MERDYTIAIDLGEGSVRVAAGYRDSSGRITIAAMNSQKSQGVKRGRIENIIEVTDAMSKAIASVEQKLNIKIQRAYCGISGEFVHTVQHDETIDILNIKSGVSNNDIKKLRELMSTVQASEGDMILDMSPLNYSVDAKSRVKNPLGALGKRIGACYNFILCEKDAYNRLKSTFEHSEIGIKQCFANFSVLGSSVVSKEEKEAGVAVVDLGQGVTNVAIYYKNALQYSISIPIGSSALDRDLTSLKISAQNVEDIKKKYGRAIAEGAELTTMNLQGRTSREFVEVPLVNIATVLEERMTDIVKFVENEIANAGFTELLHGIVLCGGGSNLAQVDKLFSRHLCETIRIATNIYISKQSPVRNAVNPEFATLMGIMNQGVMRDERGVGEPCTAPNMEYEDNVGHESAAANRSESAAEIEYGVEVEEPRINYDDSTTANPKRTTKSNIRKTAKEGKYAGQPRLFPDDEQRSDEESQTSASKGTMRSIFAGVKDSFKEASDNFSGLFSSQNKSVKDNDSEEGKHVDDVDIEY